jgi:hypothetical protein
MLVGVLGFASIHGIDQQTAVDKERVLFFLQPLKVPNYLSSDFFTN